MGGFFLKSPDELLDELEDIVAGAGNVPFSGKCLIDADDIMHVIYSLRSKIPADLKEAEKITAANKEIISSAEAKAKSIVSSARLSAADIIKRADTFSNHSINNHPIIIDAKKELYRIRKECSDEAINIKLQAQNESLAVHDEILSKAYAESDRIVQQARENAMKLDEMAQQRFNEVNSYAEEVLGHLFNTNTSALNAVNYPFDNLADVYNSLKVSLDGMTASIQGFINTIEVLKNAKKSLEQR